MEKVFHDKNGMQCIFTDKGITFRDSRRDIFYPYGCLDSLNLSLLGIMQAVCRSQVCCFAVGHKDKAEFKQMMKMAKEAMAAAPAAEAVVVERSSVKLDGSLPREDQLKQLKAMYVQGVLGKDQYDLEKRLLAM